MRLLSVTLPALSTYMSRVAPLGASFVGAGDKLRARHRAEMDARARLREKIEALERGDFENLPQGIYLDGIVRQANQINAAVYQQYIDYPIDAALSGRGACVAILVAKPPSS